MSFEPTPTQALLLFGLLAKHGECPQAELMPAPSAADREALAGAKLVAVEKVSRAYHLALTDAGWAWAGAHFSAELPSAHGTLHDLLARLGEHLAKSGETLAAFIGAKPEHPAKAATLLKATPKVTTTKATKPRSIKPKPAKAKENEATKKPASKAAKLKAPTAAALRKRIGEAYLVITGGKKNESVALARLRAELADLDRATLDAALGRILQGDKKASLMRHDDPRRIGKADEDAAYNPAGEPFHVLWIAS